MMIFVFPMKCSRLHLLSWNDADTKLHRDKLVKGREDAMLNLHLRIEAIRVGDVSHADELLDNIARYNQDDCLSTKLLRDW